MHSGTDGSVSGNITASGGTLNYAGYTTAITFDLGDGAGVTTGIGGTWSGITTLTGSSNSDTVKGSGNTYTLAGTAGGSSAGITWTSIENLQDSGAGVFNMGTNGSVTSISAVGGSVNYGSYASAVSFDLGGGASTGITGSWSGITGLTGNGSTTVKGAGQTYNLTNPNAGNNGTVFWTSVQNLTDSGAGDFKFGSGASVSGNIKAVGGTIDYGSFGAAVTFNLGGSNTTGIGGTWTGITDVIGSGSAGANSNTIKGANQTYTLSGLDAGSNGTVSWTSFGAITDTGTGTLSTSGGQSYEFTSGSNQGTVAVLSGGFSGIGNATDTGAASFLFDAGSHITGNLSANQGSIDYSASTTAANITISNSNASGYTGSMSAIVGGTFTGIISITGSNTAPGKITGDGVNGTWNVGGVNSGTYKDTGSTTLDFFNFNTLVSGAGTDTFNLNTGGSVATITGSTADTVNVNGTFGSTSTALSITAGNISGPGELDASTLTLSGTALGVGAGNRLNIDAATSLLLSNSAGVDFINSVTDVAFASGTTAASIDLTAAGNTSGGSVTTTGALKLVGDQVNLSSINIGGVFAADTSGANGDITIGNVTGNPLVLGAVDAGSGFISISSSHVDIQANGSTTLTSGGTTLTTSGGSDVDFTTGVAINAGDLTINTGSGVFNLNGTLNMAGANLVVQNLDANGATVNGGGGSITLNGTTTGNSLALSGGAAAITLATVNLTGTLTLSVAASSSVTLNNNVNVGTFNASGLAGDLVIGGTVALTDGTSLDLSHVKGIVGRSNGVGALSINDGNNTVTLGTVGAGNRRLKSLSVKAGTINTVAVNTVNGQAYTGAVNLNNTWANTGTGDITVTGAITLTGTAKITNSGTGGGITLTGKVDGKQLLTLDAKGAVAITDAVGSSAALTGLAVTGSSITLGSTVKTSSDQIYTGNLNLNGGLNSTGGSISFASGDVDVLKNLAIQADTISFSGTHTVDSSKGASLTLVPQTQGRDIVIGGSAAGQLNLDGAALSGYQGTLFIGALPKDPNSAAGGINAPLAGDVTVNSAIAVGSGGTLVIVSPGTLTINATVQAPTLILGATTAVVDPNGAQVIGTNIFVIGGTIGAQGADITGSALGGGANLSWGTASQSAQFDMKGVQVATVPGGDVVNLYASPDELDVSVNTNAHSQNSGQQAAANQQTGGLLGSGFIDVSVFQQISLYDVNGSGIQLPGDQCEEESATGTGCGQ
jgi:hypothetical protein